MVTKKKESKFVEFVNKNSKLFAAMLLVLGIACLFFYLGYLSGATQAHNFYNATLEAYRSNCFCVDKLMVR